MSTSPQLALAAMNAAAAQQGYLLPSTSPSPSSTSAGPLRNKSVRTPTFLLRI